MKYIKKLLAKISFNAPLTLAFAGISLIALALDAITGGWVNAHLLSVYRSSPADPLTYLRLFLHPLGHASWAHYAGNMALFLIVAPGAEEKYGWKRLLLLMLATSLLTGLTHILFSANGAMLGASGVVFMCILLSAVTGGRREGKIPLTLILVCAIYLGQEIAAGVSQSDGVSQLSHIVGGLCGAAGGLLFSRRAS